MRRLAYTTLLAFSVILFATCEKFEVKPLTKVETGTATPQATTITVNAKIIDLSGEGNDDHGFCYATHSEPTIDDGKVSKGSPKVGEFTGSIDGLTLNNQYYIRAYCSSTEGVVYGKVVAISTLDGQSALTTTSVTGITATSAVSGGNITSDGGAAITARGLVWSTSQNPTVETNNGITSNGTGTGSFTSNLTNLQPQTLYYVRAYATNSIGTVYGNQQTFTTQDGTIVLTTAAATSITATTAVSGGNITSDGGAPVTARGVVWSTSQNPTVETNNGITSNGTGTGSFTSNLTNLQPQTLYYVRAYATNSYGTQYGNQVSFTTIDGISDADGNFYTIVTIGAQVWLAENLRTTKYNDGTSIPLVTDNAAWVALSTPAYCWYSNEQATYGNTYGALYNWYAVSTTTNGGKNVCPTGWHVPTDAEWYAMENYVDPTINNPSATGWRGTDGGTKLKATSGWNSGGNGTDIYGFSALPGGYRYYDDGTFHSVGSSGLWWSSTEFDAAYAWNRYMGYGHGDVYRSNNDKRYGFSVRCVRD